MSGHPDPELLEELLRGALDGAARAGLEAHLAGCGECTRELAALRAEQALFARRAGADPASGQDALWSKVAARIAAPAQAAPIPLRPRWHRRVFGGAAVALSAAAVLALSLRVQPQLRPLGAPDAALAALSDDDDGAPDARVASALEKAEATQARAVQQLERELAAQRAVLDPAEARRFDASLRQARTRLDAARALAQGDVDGRLRVLGGYARYLRSLQRTLLESEEAAE